jgi:hypothetical protein
MQVELADRQGDTLDRFSLGSILLPGTDPGNYTDPSLDQAAQAEPRRGSPPLS